MEKNHIQQEKYIINVMGPQFWLFREKFDHTFEWIFTDNIKNCIFLFSNKHRPQIKMYNPEKSGKSNVLQNIEKDIHHITAPFDFSKPASIKDYYKKIFYGISIYLRFGGMKKLQNQFPNVDGDYFDYFYNLYKINTNLIIQADKLDVINFMTNEVDKIDIKTGIIYLKNIEAGIISYDYDGLILSDNPIVCNHKCIDWMFFPLNSKQLFCANRKESDRGKEYRAAFNDGTRDWVHGICQRAHIFLVAHKNIDPKMLEGIKKEYEKGTYKFTY